MTEHYVYSCASAFNSFECSCLARFDSEIMLNDHLGEHSERRSLRERFPTISANHPPDPDLNESDDDPLSHMRTYEITVRPRGDMFTGIGYKGWRLADVTFPDGTVKRMSIMLSEAE